MNPIHLFKELFEQEMLLSKNTIPTAACLSTIGLDGFPNARTVSLKEIVNNAFIITGTINSRKGVEINNNSNVALTFWWTETEIQVRIQGRASRISNSEADRYFKQRDINSQAVSTVCQQGNEVHNLQSLKNQVQELIASNKEIKRPKDWGGFSIIPIRVELMQFKKSRFHERTLYEFVNDKWTSKKIQP